MNLLKQQGRLWFISGTTTEITTAKPTLMCADNANEDYSRYSVESQIIKSGKTTNGDLTYSIALLSADELVMAGAFRGKTNNSYYLHNEATIGSKMWWTMTPYRFFNSNALVFDSDVIYATLQYSILNYNHSVRPVINLRADLIVESGNGTSGSGAYKVKLPN